MTGLRAPAVIVSHDREFLARTVNRVVELDLAQRQVGVYQGGYQAYLARAGGSAPACARGSLRESTPAPLTIWLTDRARTQRATGWPPGRTQRPPQGAGTTTRSGQAHRGPPGRDQREAGRQGAPDRAADRAPGRGRGAAQGMATADDRSRPRRAPGGGNRATRRGGAARVVRAGAGGRPGRLGGPDRDHRPERFREVHAAGRDARAAAAGAPGRRCSGRVSGSARSIRHAGCSWAHSRWSRRSGPRCRPGPNAGDAHPAGQVRAGQRDHAPRPAEELSPGERTRAALALLQGRGVNLLVLDEPTNHLDLAAIEQLESALASYQGTLLLVTHDRRMLDDGPDHPSLAGHRRPPHRVLNRPQATSTRSHIPSGVDKVSWVYVIDTGRNMGP